MVSLYSTENQEAIKITERWLSSIAKPQEQSAHAFALFTGVPQPRFNCILRFAPQESVEEIDALLAKASEGVPIAVWLNPDQQNVIDALKKRGFELVGRFPAMVWSVKPVALPELEVRPADMPIYHEILGEVGHFSEEVKKGYSAILGTKGGEHYLVYLEGKPIGTGTLFYEGDVGGIFHIATLPEYQKRGAGRAMMLSLMNRAHELGLKKLYLFSSPVAEKLYSSLGFEKVGDAEIYTGKK